MNKQEWPGKYRNHENQVVEIIEIGDEFQLKFDNGETEFILT